MERAISQKYLSGILKIFYLSIGVFLVVPLTFLVPKKRNLMLFIGSSEGQFRDNVKYLYLHLYRSNPHKVDFFFLTENHDIYTQLQDHGLPTLFYPNFSTFWIMLRTSIVIVDNYEWVKNIKYHFLFNAYKVQLWHGCSIKSLGLDNEFLTARLKTIWAKIAHIATGRFCNYNLLLSTSKVNTEKIFKPAFKFSKIIESGYPRNDIFLLKPDAYDLIGADSIVISHAEKCKKGYKIVLYSPTFRDTGSGNDFLDKEALDLPNLDAFARKHNILIVFKIHPFRRLRFDFESFSNLIKYSDTGDVYPILPLIDLLVTDYSSIFFDFLYLNKPIIFFPYDYDTYIREDRQLKYDYDWVTPGPKCTNQENLQTLIYRCLFENEDNFKQKRRDIFNMSFSHKTGSASEQILEMIHSEIA
jgi:CDP-glycerol glycerophosphotransferase